MQRGTFISMCGVEEERLKEKGKKSRDGEEKATERGRKEDGGMERKGGKAGQVENERLLDWKLKGSFARRNLSRKEITENDGEEETVRYQRPEEERMYRRR
jgi:hypothetical protein